MKSSNSRLRNLDFIRSRTFGGWKEALCIVKPETVIRWQHEGFRIFWRYKSRRKIGRPVVAAEMRRLIRWIAAENTLWSPERIHYQLVSLGFDPPAPNTIRKYLPEPTGGRRESSQVWKTFFANHMDVTWAMDFLVVPTLTFRLLYVFVIVSHDRMRIMHFGITRHPTMDWVVQQLREATAFGVQPKYADLESESILGGLYTNYRAKAA